MARKRSPERDQAFEMWKKSGGTMPLKDIADALGQPEGTVRGWKAKDEWEHQLNGTLRTNKRNAPINKNATPPAKIAKVVKEVEADDLTEKQRLFCLYYVKCFNGTQAAIKAGYSKEGAHVRASELLRISKIRAHIKRLKGTIAEELFIDAMDILNAYMKIAFSDITDVVEFGQKDVPIVTEKGLIKDKDGKIVTQSVNFIDLKPSLEVDGSLIQEVKQGKEGVAIKLMDRMKALEKLERYFDLLPDHHKRKIAEERLKLDQEKLALDKAKAGEAEDSADDGFLTALAGKVTVWEDFKDGDEDAEA